MYKQCQNMDCEHFGGLPICNIAGSELKTCDEYIHPSDRLANLTAKIRKFAVEREWLKYHTPKNLVEGVMSELGELAGITRWKTEAEVLMLEGNELEELKNEWSDCMILLLRFADVMNINPSKSIENKIEINKKNYKIKDCKGNNKKYTEFNNIILRNDPIEKNRKHIRSEPISTNDCRVFGCDKDGYLYHRAYIENNYHNNNDGTITDRATGLMWQQDGLDDVIYQKDASAYIEKLNKESFAGYTDWRLPTIDELLSLLESERQSNELYINPMFGEQSWCWSSDIRPGGGAWFVLFFDGDVDWNDLDVSYVRAVRSDA